MFGTSMASLPLLATETDAGALNEFFSNESQLEIWAPNFLNPGEFELNSCEGVCVKDSSRSVEYPGMDDIALNPTRQVQPHGMEYFF